MGLYDSDGDLVVLSDSIPNDQVFTVIIPNVNYRVKVRVASSQ